MFEVPKKAKRKVRIAKAILMKHWPKEVSAHLKDVFNAEVDRVVLKGELTKRTTGLPATKNVHTIYIVQVELKGREFNREMLLSVSRALDAHVLFLLHYGEMYLPAVVDDVLYVGQWTEEDRLPIQLEGDNLESLWRHMVEQVRGNGPRE